MTNAQKWVAIFLGVFVILFLLAKLTEKDETDINTEDYYSQTESAQPASQDGMTLLQNTGCLGCHGTDLQGTNLAPALVNLNEHWERDGLINYLRNPSSYSGDDRFEEYKKQFSGVVMPSYNNIDVKKLGEIADYLLELDK
ncbi:c-type cytochrome [Bacteroidota bacterium]